MEPSQLDLRSASPIPSSMDAFSKPRPRVPRGPAQAAQVRKQNRRQAYLERHPTYFKSMEHELADPLLYDSLVRRFQTPEEREKEGRRKGYSRVLEVDLLRGEAKLSQLAESSSTADSAVNIPALEKPTSVPLRSSGQTPNTKEEGQEMWDNFLKDRFILGQDEDFDYGPVDADDSLDTLELRDEEEAWFNDEQPGWASDTGASNVGNGSGTQLKGETGVQDF
ncbi:hypothetical protein JX265_008250 [Neoarthrinium moseri]|uniref:CCD97-like C-terminal domain-containing protein n=1 Tax=Neoarthrinium moseri TaxID=1658444 RepID=A0A9P9WIL8_9PEZI|nr:uncharacterized protein JN550_004949 [Neoarthrinium moseri]KAI1851945.1 hypothetical protein JX266_002798 [Neoarthrinium moseri]KAI1865203.1 hypothetical protein JX265_008250 [Neoarthrinium moseri]KAI1870803.1 hypothetical protein JN550_004949 [Neoarthrinium moseri]